MEMALLSRGTSERTAGLRGVVSYSFRASATLFCKGVQIDRAQDDLIADNETRAGNLAWRRFA
jgi:hypothetical protein